MGWIGNGGPELGRAGVDGTMPDRTSRHTSRSRNRGESGNSVPSSSRYLAMAIAMGRSAEQPGRSDKGFCFYFCFNLVLGHYAGIERERRADR